MFVVWMGVCWLIVYRAAANWRKSMRHLPNARVRAASKGLLIRVHTFATDQRLAPGFHLLRLHPWCAFMRKVVIEI
jgi:hypothetical protein